MSRFKVLQKIQISRRGVSSYVTGVPFQTQNLTLDDFLKNSCERDSSALMAAFDQTNCTFTFGQMNKEAEKIAAGFISMGAKQGDRIAIFGPNEPQWLILKWACAKAGFQMVCINPLYTAYELEYAINKVGIKILVCPKSVGDALNYHKILTVMIPDLETQDKFNLNSKNVDVLEKIVFYSTDEEIGGVINWKDVEEAGDQSHYKILADVKIDTHDIANIQFTSGTTGMPKAAALSHYNITNTTIASFQHQNSIIDHYNKTSVIINVLPLYHVFSFTNGSVSGAFVGSSNIYPAPGFNSSLAIKCIEKYGGTHLIGTPTMFSDILNNPLRKQHNISSLAYAIVGGAPVTPSLAKTAEEELGLKIGVGYGMTENTCGTFLVPHGSGRDVTLNTVGTAQPGLEAKIIDSDENTLEVGEVGELVTKGFYVFKGYINDEQKTKESFTKDGYFKTGDLAFVREDKHLKMAGRSKDMIIRGGENIQPTEIENFLTSLSEIKDAYVIGVPSKRLGEQVAAYVELKEGCQMSKSELIEKCKTGLARFKIPKYVKFTTTWPTTTTGKIKKFELRNWAKEHFPELADEIVE